MSSSSATYGSSTSSSPSSAASASTSSHDPPFAVVGAVLGIIGSVLLVGILILTLRVRRQQRNNGQRNVGPYQGTAVLDKNHPAARIVPFGTPRAEGHSFRHVPGKDMRIAIRRPDGAWDFTHPSEPFTPTGVSDICPSPVSSTTHLISSSMRKDGESSTHAESPRSAVMEYKEQESRAAKMIRLGYDARDNLDDSLEVGNQPLPHPPPAYGHEPTVGPFVTFKPSGSRVPSHSGF